MTDSFKVDNFLIQQMPKLYGARRTSNQLYLPGMEPFGPFDLWATLALYSLLDPQNPGAAVQTTPTELLEVLDFAKVISEALGGYETHKSKNYGMVEESLHRLYSVDIYLSGFYSIKTGGRGRPRKQLVEYRGRILASYRYTYPEGVTTPDMEKPSKVTNVNRSETVDGSPPPPIWKLRGIRPEGIEYRLAPDLVEGLEGGRIGSTIFPLQIFKLRRRYQPKPIATKLLVWTLRQVNQNIIRDADKLLADALNVKGKDRNRDRQNLLEYLKMLQEDGIIEAWSYDPATNRVEFQKAESWHFGRGKSLIGQEDGDGEDGEE